MATTTDLTLGARIHRWRLVCPLNHRGRPLVPQSDHWTCSSCRDTTWRPNHRFETVRDQVTGRRVAPGDVEIVGPERVEIRKVPTTDD